MDPVDFSDLADPILDLPGGLNGDTVNEDYYYDDEGGDDGITEDAADDNLVGKELRENDANRADGRGVEPDDVEFQDKRTVVVELQKVCDRLGVPCTKPMINLVESSFDDEIIFSSSLIWFVRGISLANQTQVLPTVMGAIDDMKVETRTLQQSTHKINKEVERAERLAADIHSQMISVRDEMTKSFRDTIAAFIQGETDRVVKELTSPVERDLPMGAPSDTRPATSEKKKEVINATATVRKETTAPVAKAMKTKADEYRDEKKRMLMKLGFKPIWIEAVEDETIDLIYDDDFHAGVLKMKLNPGVKKLLMEEIMDNVSEITGDK
ncbi:TPA_asm: P [Utricularia alphacytorhabdovirus 1]|nr:TPA_asm: P [Utricularia alphacytorhabdovirus 1]